MQAMNDASQPTPDHQPDPEVVDLDDFSSEFGVDLLETLDVGKWQQGVDLEGLNRRLAEEVSSAVAQERDAIAFIRREVFPRLRKQVDAPADAGVYQAHPQDIDQALRNSLFNGCVEACDGTVSEHDTLVLTVTQLGICLVSYQGEQLSLSQRLFRRDLRITQSDNPEGRVRDLLARRLGRSAIGVQDPHDTLSELARRGVMGYAERAVLLEQSSAPWRLGHGSVAPYELLTGGGLVKSRSMPLLDASAKMLRSLILEHERFIFVPSTIADRWLVTVGNALRPLEYAIVESGHRRMAAVVNSGHYAGHYKNFAQELVDAVGKKVVVGVFRAAHGAPTQVFFAHPDHAHEAAVIAMADSVLQEHRGFPMLIDIAHHVVNTTMGHDAFKATVSSAYVDAGAPFRFASERETR
jgi:hypothetical protein